MDPCASDIESQSGPEWKYACWSRASAIGIALSFAPAHETSTQIVTESDGKHGYPSHLQGGVFEIVQKMRSSNRMAENNLYLPKISLFFDALLTSSVGVANSGGPDSTCLLFLIHRHLNEADTTTLPRSVLSLTVDHGLQDSSVAMAERCAKSAAAIGARHITTRITWSVPPFPARPSEGTAFEKIAREARFQLLLQAMNSVDANIIAFGHHADDQVETSLMRLAKGSTELGAGGMRRCRRWGMGMGTGDTSLGWAGVDGLRKWIVRPLLDVSKVSIRPL